MGELGMIKKLWNKLTFEYYTAYLGDAVNRTTIRHPNNLKFIKMFHSDKKGFGVSIWFELDQWKSLIKETEERLIKEGKKIAFSDALIHRSVKELFFEKEVLSFYKYQISHYYNKMGTIDYQILGPLRQKYKIMVLAKKADAFLDLLDDYVYRMGLIMYEEQEVRNKEIQAYKDSYQIDASIPNDFRNYMDDNGLYYYTNEIYQQHKQHVYMDAKKATNIPVFSSKLGGHPDLLEDSIWPYNGQVPLSFLGQIKCSDVPALKDGLSLPETGILSFFYDMEDLPWESDESNIKVMYQASDDIGSYKNRTSLEGAHVFDESILAFSVEYSFSEEVVVDFLDYDDEKSFDEMVFGNHFRLSHLFGYSQNIQDPIKEEMNFSDEEYDDWLVLLQLDSEESSDMMWGDDGKLYFMIHKEDLKNKNFDNVKMSLQCY
jgi:uncharacterized protein YwqG